MERIFRPIAVCGGGLRIIISDLVDDDESGIRLETTLDYKQCFQLSKFYIKKQPNFVHPLKHGLIMISIPMFTRTGLS